VNAGAVAAAAAHLLSTTERAVTVVACGERWPVAPDDEPLRFAVEDYVGAGAILAELAFPKSPEAALCDAAFRGARDHLERLMWDCGSGRELREKGLAADVQHAARLNLYGSVPTLHQDRLEGLHPDDGQLQARVRA
jgi:2-phosphosulfolactate phosphatase